MGTLLPFYFQKEASAGPDQSLVCGLLQLVGDKCGRSIPRSWCVIPRDDPLVLYVYAAPQVCLLQLGLPILTGEGKAGLGHYMPCKEDGETKAL